MAKFEGELKVLPISALHENPDNIREDYGDLPALVEEIKTFGVQVPLIVYPHPKIDGDYMVREGNRRYVASLQAQLTEVPCIVKPASARDRVADVDMMMTTGRSHKALKDAEVSKGIQRYFDLGQDITTIGKKTKMSRKEVQSRADLARKDNAVSKAYTSGRLSLEAASRLQELEVKSGDPKLYERVVEKIDSMPNGASIQTVESTIATTEAAIRRDTRRAELNAVGAQEASYDQAYSESWAVYEDELSDEEHVAAKHRYRLEYATGEAVWYAKVKQSTPELSEAEKQDRQRQSQLNGLLKLDADTRRKFVGQAVMSVKPDEKFARGVLTERIMVEGDCTNEGIALLGVVASNTFPGTENHDEVKKWQANVRAFLLRLPLAKLALILELCRTVEVEGSLAKISGFERSEYEKGYASNWKRRREYYQVITAVLGYELTAAEKEVMRYQAGKVPGRDAGLDIVSPDDEVTSTCEGCSQEVVTDSQWTGVCHDCSVESGAEVAAK